MDSLDTDFDNIWGVAQQIEGWLLKSQARALFDAASQVAPETAIVEIGSHRGKSTVVLASASRSDHPVVAVDPFDDPRWGGGAESLSIFLNNLDRAGVSDRVKFLRGLSADVSASWEGPSVGLLWVDGAHDRASVLADLDGWLAHVCDGGLVYIHDAFSAVGTTQAVLQRLLANRSITYMGSVRTLVTFRKGPVSIRRTALSSLALGARIPFFAHNVAIKFVARKNWHWALTLLRYDRDVGLI